MHRNVDNTAKKADRSDRDNHKQYHISIARRIDLVPAFHPHPFIANYRESNRACRGSPYRCHQGLSDRPASPAPTTRLIAGLGMG